MSYRRVNVLSQWTTCRGLRNEFRLHNKIGLIKESNFLSIRRGLRTFNWEDYM